MIDGIRTYDRLVGIQAPKLPLGRPGFSTWPLAWEAKRALERLVLGQRVTLSFGGRRRSAAFGNLELEFSAWRRFIRRSAGPVEPNCHGSI